MANISKIKVSGVTYDIVDSSAIHSLDGFWNSGETQSAITAATSALAEAIAEQGYQTSGDVQNAISGKADTTAVTQAISEATSGKLDTSTFATYSGNVDTALASKFAGASWNSTDKKIYFYDNASNTGTALAYIDGTDFVKDGFLSSVTIDNRTISGESVPCLVFIWNTDSGIQETDIPLSGIFNPTNYVDVETYTAYTAATEAVLSGKQETLSAGTGIDITDNTISVTGVPMTIDDTVTSGSTNPVKSSGIYNFVTGETATKQDTLVSGTNIKTVGGETILGSGNVQTLHASIGTGDDAETLILELS
jgi:hypothetical protein